MPLLLPFTTFGEAAAFDLDVELVCRCRRTVVVDGSSPFFRDRRIMDARFTCTTILPHGARCTAVPTVYIRKRGRRGWTLADHSRAMRSRQADALPADARRTFRSFVQRGEVAQLYDQGCACPTRCPTSSSTNRPGTASSTGPSIASCSGRVGHRATFVTVVGDHFDFKTH